jgi:hypothetical protein
LRQIFTALPYVLPKDNSSVTTNSLGFVDYMLLHDNGISAFGHGSPGEDPHCSSTLQSRWRSPGGGLPLHAQSVRQLQCVFKTKGITVHGTCIELGDGALRMKRLSQNPAERLMQRH